MSGSQSRKISHINQHQQISLEQSLAKSFDKSGKGFRNIFNLLDQFGLSPRDLQYFSELSPYLILDGHRSGMGETNDQQTSIQGYIEGAEFSLRFSKILKSLGGKNVTFLIHTLRNYQTTERMASIFSAVKKIGKEFIMQAAMNKIQLRYFGKNVHTNYSLSRLINAAEYATKNDAEFTLNYLTNYSEEWSTQNPKEIADVPDINVIGRFTKGHFSGANIPCHTNKANFVYIQQASISRNWNDTELICLALSLLKSYIALNGFIGGKIYAKGEKALIYEKRECVSAQLDYDIDFDQIHASKRIISFSAVGPIMISF